MNIKKSFMTIPVTVGCFLLFLCLAQQRVFAQQRVRDFEEVKTLTIHGVIVPQDRAAEFYTNREGYFTPSREDIMKAESRLVDYIEDTIPQMVGYPFVPDLDKKLSNYKRQYVGILVNGEKKIWMNFFCYVLNFDWKHYPYYVAGGGGCYFNVLYDIKSETFSRLIINGL